jgi:hypothetical protein
VLLPTHCSAKVNEEECQLIPSYVVSIKSEEGEYMLAAVCNDHKEGLEARLVSMQNERKVPQGRILFQPIKAVVTECVRALNDDYIDLELKRGGKSDRNII